MIDTIFFDRDGILNEIVFREGKVSSPRTVEEFRLRSDFIVTYQQLSDFDLEFFICSNQPDISRSLLDKAALNAMTATIESNFRFKEIVYCEHDDHHQCLCRKPKPGMLNYLIEKYDIDCSRSIFVGDSEKDLLAGAAAGVRTVYLRQHYNQLRGCQADYIVDSLKEILAIIKDD